MNRKSIDFATLCLELARNAPPDQFGRAESPHVIADTAVTIVRAANSLRRIAELQCNGRPRWDQTSRQFIQVDAFPDAPGAEEGEALGKARSKPMDLIRSALSSLNYTVSFGEIPNNPEIQPGEAWVEVTGDPRGAVVKIALGTPAQFRPPLDPHGREYVTLCADL